MRIELAMELVDGTKYMQPVNAYRFGAWAAHQMPLGREEPPRSKRGGWRVSHAPTGFGIMTLIDDVSESDAKRIAKALNSKLPESANWTRPPEFDPWSYIVQAVVAEAL